MKTPSLVSILDALKTYNDHEMPIYSNILLKSFQEVNPIFFKDDYASFFWDCASTVPGWMQSVVLANAEAESLGSEKLTEIWQRTHFDKKIEDEILYHAKDESRHSRLFIRLVSFAFPDYFSENKLDEVYNNLNVVKKNDLIKIEKNTSEPEILDELIQMNLGEIRTLVHMHFLGPIIFSLTPKEKKQKVHDILQGLANDEIVHIGYTSKIINDWSNDGNKKLVESIYTNRLKEFHKITIQQTDETYKNYHNGKYPNLLEL